MSHNAAGESLIQDSSQITFKEPTTSAFEVEGIPDTGSPLHRQHGSTDGAFLSLLVLAFFWWASTLIRVHWQAGLPSPSHDFLGRACGKASLASQNYLYIPLNVDATGLDSVDSLDMTAPVCISKCPTIRQQLEQRSLREIDPFISDSYPESIMNTPVYKTQPFGDFLCLPVDAHPASEIIKELHLSSTKVKLWLVTEQLASRSSFLTWVGVLMSAFAAILLIYTTLQNSVVGLCIVAGGPALMGVLLSVLHSVAYKSVEPFASRTLGMQSAISIFNIGLLIITCFMAVALLFYSSRIRLSTVTLNVTLDVVKALPTIIIIPSLSALCIAIMALSALMAWAPLAVSLDQQAPPPTRMLTPTHIGPWRRLEAIPPLVNIPMTPQELAAHDNDQDQQPLMRAVADMGGDESDENSDTLDGIERKNTWENPDVLQAKAANSIDTDAHVKPASVQSGVEVRSMDDGPSPPYLGAQDQYPRFTPVNSILPLGNNAAKNAFNPEDLIAGRDPREAPIPPLDIHNAPRDRNNAHQEQLPELIVDTRQQPLPIDSDAVIESIDNLPRLPDIVVDSPSLPIASKTWESLPLSRRVEFQISWGSIFRAVCFVTSALFLIEAALAIDQFLVAAWCCVWYFSVPDLGGRRDLNYADIRTATSRVFSLHLGSVALIAALNILLRFIKPPAFLMSFCPPLVKLKKQLAAKHPKFSHIVNALSVSMEAVSETTISECLLQGTDLITAAQNVVDRHHKDKAITRLLKFAGTLSSIGVLWTSIPLAGITTFILVQSLPTFRDPYSPLYVNAPHLMALAAMTVTHFVLCAFTVAVSQTTETIVSCYRLERQDASNSRICTPDQLNVTASEIQAAATRMMMEEGESDSDIASTLLLSTNGDEQSAPYMAMRPPAAPTLSKPTQDDIPTAATIDPAANTGDNATNGFLIRSPWPENPAIQPVPPADEELIAEIQRMSADGGLRIN